MPERRQKPTEVVSSKELAAMGKEAVDIFKKEDPEAFKELAETFNGKSADVALFGHGKFHVSVKGAEVKIEPDKILGVASSGRGAIYPETLVAILEGKLTVLEAFHKGDLIARSDSADLHLAYNNFVKFSDAALRSKRLQELLAMFRKKLKI